MAKGEAMRENERGRWRTTAPRLFGFGSAIKMKSNGGACGWLQRTRGYLDTQRWKPVCWCKDVGREL